LLEKKIMIYYIYIYIYRYRANKYLLKTIRRITSCVEIWEILWLHITKHKNSGKWESI